MSAGCYEFLYHFFPQENLPLATKAHNLLKSIPNDDDLSSVYFNENSIFLDKKRALAKLRLRKLKLRLVLECYWDGFISVHLSGQSKSIKWLKVYFVIQSHRVVWWNSDEDLENGQKPLGQLLLLGHAGVMPASLLEAREVNDASRLLSIFGRDLQGNQQKITILAENSVDIANISGCIKNLVD